MNKVITPSMEEILSAAGNVLPRENQKEDKANKIFDCHTWYLQPYLMKDAKKAPPAQIHPNEPVYKNIPVPPPNYPRKNSKNDTLVIVLLIVLIIIALGVFVGIVFREANIQPYTDILPTADMNFIKDIKYFYLLK